ncbi:MAG: surface-adhesin E family protein [Pseudomonas piscis]|uniref:surface-adhesin E family protein n=1 Tax=Pseudomonas piscis TaxID=2614538 RepID=UPI003D27983B
MKRLWLLGGVLLLVGCAHDQAGDAGAARPEAMFKVLDTPESATYFAANSLALYQNNPHLRQFYLINNYSKPTAPGDSKPLIHSSRVVRIINCERDESAQLGRVYFSEPFAQGVEVMRKEAHAQWAAFPRQSVIGELRNMACGIDAARLGAPPFKGPQGD